MNQPWYMNHPLIDKHGNFGSVYGDEAASQRYTEARLSKFAEDVLLSDMSKSTVDFIPNFDNTLEEPVVMPAKLPLNLINGSFGISAGFAANIPPHNLREVVSETIKYIEDETYQIKLMPDYPTGGTIINGKTVEKGYTEGNSKVVIQSDLDIDEKNHRLILRSVPYMKSLDTVVESIQIASTDTIVNGKKVPKVIEGIKNIRNKSSKGNIELIIEVKKDYDLDLIKNQLYGFTHCQTTIPFSLIGVNEGEFEVYKNVNEMVKAWYDFRSVTIRRKITEKIKNLKYKIHLNKGLLIALHKNNIDQVIKIIRESSDKKSMIQQFKDLFNLDAIQSEYIINLKLYRINNIEVKDLESENNKLVDEVNDLVLYFKEPKRLKDLIISELKELSKKYGKDRITKISNSHDQTKNVKEQLIPNSNHTFICTTKYIKKLKGDNFKVQKKGGKGVAIGKLKDGDVPLTIFNGNNKDNLLLFTDSGKVYLRKGYEISGCELQNLGFSLSSIIKDDKLTNIMVLTNEEMNDDNISILLGTKLNKVKKVNISEYRNISSNGIIGTKLNDGDNLIFAQKVNNNTDSSLVAVTNSGTTINVSTHNIPEVLRPTFGSSMYDKSVVDKGDQVVSYSLVTDDVETLFFITKNGLGKRVKIEEFPEQNRVGKGRIGIKVREDDFVVKVLSCDDKENLNIISNTNVMSININDTSILLRPTFGNTIKKLGKDEEILDVTLV
ncbi:DNA gyrase subunit A [Bacillus phage vB_BpuM-BpSp]|nr:DNA gyrase subunit A [Bacillus phage vB_BpuM-BpSp]